AITDNLKPEPIRIAKTDDVLGKAFEWPLELDVVLRQPHHPVFERARRHREGRRLHHAGPGAPAVGQDERKERENRSWTPGSIAVVEVKGPGIVEVDGRLHQPQAENTRVEVDIRLRIDRDRSDMVYAGDVLGHRMEVKGVA